MNTIRIFIASSSELRDDRDEFRMFISRENDRLHTKGIYLEVVQWEFFLDAISDTRLQDEYNKAIAKCDIVLCLFFTKVGKYTSEEFDTAYQVFKDTGKPKIWTYFKNAEINTGSITDEINTLLAFKKKIAGMGHFYTQYSNVDNLINQYRSQLDRFLDSYEQNPISENSNTNINKKSQTTKKEPVKNTFNVLLTKKLIQAIKPYNKKANDFLGTYSDWEAKEELIPTVKRIIISGYVGVLGIQLRKLMSIGEEDFSESKMKRYLENCQLTAKRALQLICYTLISKLWDNQSDNTNKLSQTQSSTLIKFFKNSAEMNILDFADLMNKLIEVYSENSLELPMPQLKDLNQNSKSGKDFVEACQYLNDISDVLNSSFYKLDDCGEAEKNLTIVFECFSFLAEYKMISIKDIAYSQQRNELNGLYLHNYTLLEGDSQTKNDNQSKIRKESTPVNSYAVLLFKDNYRENINLVPFIIDYNGLADAGGSKICFYSFCNTFGNLDLNYNFIEDDTRVVVKESGNPKPDDADIRAVNSWLANKDNRKDMNFDTVFNLFHEAKKVLTGIEDENNEDIF